MAYIIVHHQPADGKSLSSRFSPRMTKCRCAGADGGSVKSQPCLRSSSRDAGNHGRRYLPAYSPGQTPGWPKNIPFFCNPSRNDRQNGRSQSSCQDSTPIGVAPALKIDQGRRRLVFPRSSRRPGSRICPQSAVKRVVSDRLLSPTEIAAQTGRIGAERARFQGAGYRFRLTGPAVDLTCVECPPG